MNRLIRELRLFIYDILVLNIAWYILPKDAYKTIEWITKKPFER